jgi:hypothetical protein
MRKVLMMAGLFLVAGFLLAGCGGVGGVEGNKGRTLRGNVSYCKIGSTQSNANHATISVAGVGLPSYTAHSNASGDYSITNINPGNYFVTADYSTVTNQYTGFSSLMDVWFETWLNGTATQHMSETFPDPSSAIFTVANVTITDNSTTTLDFQLQGY